MEAVVGKDYWIIKIPSRSGISLTGPDARTFLQGLVTNDILEVGFGILYTALLNAQGRYLFDFFVIEQGDDLLIDCEDGTQAEELVHVLTKYRLRSNIKLKITTLEVYVSSKNYSHWKKGPVHVDPRTSALGYRLYNLNGPVDIKSDDFDLYDILRIQYAIPDGRRDLIPGKSIILENRFVEMNAISWKKGCYIGQELIARTWHAGEVRKTLVPLSSDKIIGPFGSLIFSFKNENVGKTLSACGFYALGHLRKDAIQDALRFGLSLENGQKLTLC